MNSQTRHEAMQRKPILMPPKMISKIDKIAQGRNISFAEVVREAVNAFDSDLSFDNATLIEALADTMIRTTKEVVAKIEALEKRLDETHDRLEGGR